jgi:hypothetical protein
MSKTYPVLGPQLGGFFSYHWRQINLSLLMMSLPVCPLSCPGGNRQRVRRAMPGPNLTFSSRIALY